MNVCKECGKTLEADERAIYLRLVSRAATEFLCIDCLAKHYRCDRSVIMDRIAYYKEIGCALFAKSK